MTNKLWILTGLIALAASSTIPPSDSVPMGTTEEDCDDDAQTDCWSRPDIDCFGIYEPWSKVHCPLRCGFCPNKVPPCEDKLEYCAQFEDSTCTGDNYRIWARTNCRKHCNLCAVPTRPPGHSAGTTQAGGTTVAGGSVTGGSTPVLPGNVTVPAASGTTMASSGGSGGVTDIPGTVARGRMDTFIIEGPASLMDGSCLYKGMNYTEGERWNDGCDYECACMDADTNRVVCTDRCTRWETVAALTDCKLVSEENECCQKLECN